ncbi:MAG: CARDB domain-containing protein [Thermoplasmata archaeon]
MSSWRSVRTLGPVAGGTAEFRRISGDRRGAAEVIGDLLLVAMSVVMVTALALQLSTVQGPSDSVTVDLEAAYDGQIITITHMGGDTLHNHTTRFALFVNETFVSGYNLTDGTGGDASLGMGERWTMPFNTSPSDRLKIQVIDTAHSVILLDQVLQKGPETGGLPDLGLTPADIVVLFNNATFNDTNAPMAGDNVTVNVTVHNYGSAYSGDFVVRISDYSTIDRKSFPVMNATLALNGSSSANLSTVYKIPAGSWGIHTITVRVVPLLNESRYGNNYATKSYRVGYTVIAMHPGNPVLRIRSIDVYPRHPVHGAYVNITARIANQGGVPALANVTYYLDGTSPGDMVGVEHNLSIPVGGESYSIIVWRAPRGGIHTLIVNASDPYGLPDEQSIQLEVLPTILLVDDDRAIEGSVRDVGMYMKESLDAVAASYTTHVVPTGDGPLYDGGTHPLRDYDLVIWLTGYESVGTLTSNDKSNLATFLNNGGKLWLIGQDVLSSLGRGDPFLNNYMKVSPLTPTTFYDRYTPQQILGNGILSGRSFVVAKPFPSGLPDRADFMEPLSGKAVPAFTEAGDPYRALGLLFNATTNGTPGANTFQTAFFGFELSRVAEANERAMITYEMLNWFGCLASWGRDLAVSDQQFDKSAPAFMEDVNITIYLRNNGLSDEPLDVSRPQLQVAFYIDGATFAPKSVMIELNGSLTTFNPPTSEIWIPQDTTNASLRVPGGGGFIKISMVWTADRIGAHTITGKVDPYDYISEINENNNKVSASMNREFLYVRYGTLVIDDDGSANNGGSSYNSTANVTRALDELGYQYDLHVVNVGEDGPDPAKMSLYNALIWVAGEQANALTATDRTSLASFLGRGDGRYLWLLGPRAIPDGNYAGGAEPFYRDYLRIGSVVDPGSARTPGMIEGAYLDPIAHGVRYPAQPTSADKGRLLLPYIDGRGVTYQSPMPSPDSPNEVFLEDAEDGDTEGWAARVVPPLTSASINNVFDFQRGSSVIRLARTGASAQDTYFIIGDFAFGSDQNPNDLPWNERERLTASWSFRFDINYTFVWHVTDTLGTHIALTYTNSDTDLLGAGPVHHGLGAGTADGRWHTVTRDLQRDLREGSGLGGRTIRQVDGFEVVMNEGEGAVDDIILSRPFNGIRYENTTFSFRTVFTAWDPSFISYEGNNQYLSELAYMVLRWFNMYDARTELRVTHLDLFHTTLQPLREMKPMMGESYMLKARIWNPGGTRGDAVVRFSDGSTVINSVSVSVERSSMIVAEIIWTPIFAGSRTISVSVDPDGILSEVFKFNNVASLTIQCYFFYDDMEEGADKWTHESTIVRLNGETALEYIDAGDVYTDIVAEWSEFNGWRNTTDNMSLPNITSQFHSRDSAYYMHEPKAQRRTPVDVILTCDVTGSMAWDAVARIEGAKTAMMQFVNKLWPQDRGAVAEFSTYRPYNSYPNPPLIPYYTQLDQPLTSNKSALHDAIAKMRIGGGTPFWNAVTTSFTYIRDYGAANRIRCMVILTDGQSNSDSPSVPAGRATAFATVTTAPVPIFVIGYGADVVGTSQPDMIALAAQANLTGGGGGWYYFAPNAEQLEWVFANISKQIEEMAQTLGRGGAGASENPGGAGERVVLFYDNMEMGAGGWSVVNNGPAGSTWRYVTGDFRNSGLSAWRCYDTATGRYGNNDDDWLVSPTIDASGYVNLRLSFWHRPAVFRGTYYWGGESSWNADLGYVFISNDNGLTWYGVRSWANNLWLGYYGNPRNAIGTMVSNLDVNVIQPTSQMKIAFRMWADVAETAEGWSIDDVLLTGEPSWLSRGAGGEGGGGDEGRGLVVLLQEGFEGALSGWTKTNLGGDGVWQNDTFFKYAGSNSYRCYKSGGSNYYDKQEDDSLITPALNLTGHSAPTLFLWLRHDVDDNDDRSYIEVSNDNGATWTQLWTNNSHITSWVNITLDISKGGAVTLTDQMKIRFRFKSDNDNDLDDGWSIDEILITALTPVPPPQKPGDQPFWNDGDETPSDKWLTTATFSLKGASSARLTFWHKYNLKVGSNGGVIMVGTAPTANGPFSYRYVAPTQPYPSNLKLSEWGTPHLKDDFGNDMRWCWNGVSGAGRFSWDYVEADLTPFVGNEFVRVRFLYIFCDGGTGYGWVIDDVEVKVRRSDSVSVTGQTTDQWELVEVGRTYGDDYADGTFAFSGTHAWWNHNPQPGMDALKGGIDNSLVTIPIDLTRARDARLAAKLRFNIPFAEGRPPDGFRVEVSSDNGVSWRQLNMGARSAWNVSGTEAAGPDGTSYTGVGIRDNWVDSRTLTRLNCDLSGWAGSVILLKFRVVTRNDLALHYHDLGAGFGGIFIDDVTVIGNTTTGQGRGAGGAPESGGDGLAPAATGMPEDGGSIRGSGESAAPAEEGGDGRTGPNGGGAGPSARPTSASPIAGATELNRFKNPTVNRDGKDED